MLVHKLPKAPGIRLARKWSVTADDRGEERRQLERGEQLVSGCEWLICEYRKYSQRLEGLERFDYSLIWSGGLQQSGVVQLEKPREAAVIHDETRGREGTAYERCSAVANHAAHCVLRKGRSATLDDQRIGGIGQVVAGIDQCAVEIKRDQPL